MAKNKTERSVVRAAAGTGADVVQLTDAPGKSRARRIAEFALDPTLRNAHAAKTFASGSIEGVEVGECHKVLMGMVARAKGGDLSELEANLAAQAVTLDAMFTELTRRAAMNMGTHLGVTETYLRLAMKAQAQCRTTVETLAEIKNPRAVAFVRQANIAHGHQQVNNGDASSSGSTRGRAGARKNKTQRNKLLEGGADGERMDPGTTGAAVATYSGLAAMGAIHGTEDR